MTTAGDRGDEPETKPTWHLLLEARWSALRDEVLGHDVRDRRKLRDLAAELERLAVVELGAAALE